MSDQDERRLERDGKAAELQAARCRRGDHDWIPVWNSSRDLLACRADAAAERPAPGAAPRRVEARGCEACGVVEWALGKPLPPLGGSLPPDLAAQLIRAVGPTALASGEGTDSFMTLVRAVLGLGSKAP